MEDLNNYERDLIDNVERFGWQCTSVGGSEAGEPEFSYTIGFWESLCTPELIVFGLQSQLAFEMLWDMFYQLKGGAKLSDGARWSGLLEGYDCITRPVHSSNLRPGYFNSALWYRRRKTGQETIEAFQLFWPSVESRLFPWERGCEPAVRDAQPLLYLPADGHAA